MSCPAFTTTLDSVFCVVHGRVLPARIYSIIPFFFFQDEILDVNQTTSVQVLLILVGSYKHFLH